MKALNIYVVGYMDENFIFTPCVKTTEINKISASLSIESAENSLRGFKQSKEYKDQELFIALYDFQRAWTIKIIYGNKQ